MNEAVVFQNVSLYFNDKKIIENFNLNVEKGQKVALIGKSGSGKSSILNLIMGFVLPRTGKIFVNSLEVCPKNIRKIRTQIAWLPQNLDLGTITVKELFDLPFSFGINKKLKPSEKDIKLIFNKFDITTDLLEKRVEQISGGQKQRIILASILLTKKPIFLFDEPTSALDKKTTEIIADYFKNLNATIIFATHEHELLKIADKVINLDQL